MLRVLTKRAKERNMDGEEGVEEVFRKRQDEWYSQMAVLLENAEPYNFAVAYSRPEYRDEDVSGKKDEDVRYEVGVFDCLDLLSKADSETMAEFEKLVTTAAGIPVSPDLAEFLEKRKKECREVFEQFDEIASICEKHLEDERRGFSVRNSKQSEMQQAMLQEVDKCLAQVEEAGALETRKLKDSISSYVNQFGMSWSDSINNIYKEMNEMPPAMEFWKSCAGALTSGDLRRAFVMGQKENAGLWKEAFTQLVGLVGELERYRAHYAMTRDSMERSVFNMRRDYRDSMPRMTRMQRTVARLVDRKTSLDRDLVQLERDIRERRKGNRRRRFECCKKVAQMKILIRQTQTAARVKQERVLSVRKCEVAEYMREVVDADIFIHEKLLAVPYDKPRQSLIEKEIFDEKSSPRASPESVKTLHDDAFAEAYAALVSESTFVDLLNCVAEDLGFALDLEWAEHVRRKLELHKAVKFLELFKVFKIDFVEDLKELKSYMTDFSRRDSEGDCTFDLIGAVDGFLMYACAKKEGKPLTVVRPPAIDRGADPDFWEEVKQEVPQTLLWDALALLLIDFKQLLESRRHLVKARGELVSRNDELDTCLQGYRALKPGK